MEWARKGFLAPLQNGGYMFNRAGTHGLPFAPLTNGGIMINRMGMPWIPLAPFTTGGIMINRARTHGLPVTPLTNDEKLSNEWARKSFHSLRCQIWPACVGDLPEPRGPNRADERLGYRPRGQ